MEPEAAGPEPTFKRGEKQESVSPPAPPPLAPPAAPLAAEPGEAPAAKSRPGATTAVPKDFGRYQLQKKLGQGGMGAVFLARDSELDRLVAVKIPNFGPRNLTAKERFLREARSAGTLTHPNICPVYDVGIFEGFHYMTMAFIEGQSLDSLIQPEQLPPPGQAATLVRKVALAMQEAHQKGIIHRDLKPANVIIDRRGEPVVMDFGLAGQINAGDSRLTQAGSIMGTPAYMAPEQVTSDLKAMGPATDIYSLGVVLYELLTGKRPFEGPTALVLGMIMVAEPELPTALRPGLDPALEAVCRRAMARKIEERYASMLEFADALAPFCLDEPLPLAKRGIAPTLHRAAPHNAPPTVLGAEPATSPPTGTGVNARQDTQLLSPAVTAVAKRWGPWAIAGAGLAVAALMGMCLTAFLVLGPPRADQAKRPDPKTPSAAAPTPTATGTTTGTTTSKDTAKDTTAQTKETTGKRPETTGKEGTRKEDTPQVPLDDPERRAAEWVISLTSSIWVVVDGKEIGVKSVEDLPRKPFEVRQINLNRHPKCTDEGAVALKGVKYLTSLQLTNTKITNAVLPYFKDCAKLETLLLYATAVTDAGLPYLTGFKELKYLSLKQTAVTEPAVRKLAAALPRCRIEWNGGVIEPTEKAPGDKGP